MAHSTYGLVFSVYLCAHLIVVKVILISFIDSVSAILDGHLAVCLLDKAPHEDWQAISQYWSKMKKEGNLSCVTA